MHTNYYFLRQLTNRLEKILTGTVVSECYSQAKDELIIRFETHGKSFYIKGNFGSALHIISFPTNVERARRNSVDLFPGLIGYRVIAIRQFRNERSFSLEFEEGKSLLFKMHGNRSNLLLLQNKTPTELFRNNLPLDVELNPKTLDRELSISMESFVNSNEAPEKIFFTFGKVVWTYLRQRGYYDRTKLEQWHMIQETLALLENPSYYLVTIKDLIHLSLVPLEGASPLEGDPLEVSNRFFYALTQEFVLQREKSSALSILRAKMQSGISYQAKASQKLQEIRHEHDYKQWADLLMAHMHSIAVGNERVSLQSFYNPDERIQIKLKKELSPQQNAAVFYRKAKNQHIEIERLQGSLKVKEAELAMIERQIGEIESIEDLKQLRKTIQELGLGKTTDKKVSVVPYYEFEKSGYRIWVGKNAESNDELTLRYAYKEDLWLHAKDVAGSHVIIKHQAGKKFPKDVIERAAQLAAYNSKRKTDTLCPVVVTPRKFVRKRKGDPAGAVVVEREEVILVEPRL